MSYLVRKAIKFNEWSGGRNAEHLGEFNIARNSYFTVYDFDIKLEILFIIFAFILFFKRMLSK